MALSAMLRNGVSAYPINYENDGYYVVIDFTSDEAFPQELDRVINITDGVLRSLIVAKGE